MRRRFRSIARLALAAPIGAVVALAIGFLAAPREGAEALAVLSPDVTYFVPGAPTAVALTIDDGPDPVGTPAILDVLREHSARATFFLIGERVAGNEDLVARMLAEGHEIGNHDYTERVSALAADAELSAGIDATHEILSAFGPVRWFRPGSGLFTAALLELVRQRGYRLALGDVFPVDGRVPFARFHAWYLMRHVEPGSIVILHDAQGRGVRTAATLRRVLPVLQRRGLEIVSLTQLADRGSAASIRGTFSDGEPGGEAGPMDGIHDLGGMSGFGPVSIEPDEPVFHEPWEATAFCLNALAIAVLRAYNADEYRHSVERMDPVHYLAASYYERVLTGVATLLVEKGIVTQGELEERAGGAFPLSRPAADPSPGRGPTAGGPRFSVGEVVVVRDVHPAGHTRVPRYVRGRPGVVARVAPRFPFPDESAHGAPARREHTYHVLFEAQHLWSDAAGAGECVIVDLWESYLERAS